MRFFLCLPLNDATEGFFGADCLARLKATAVLVVVGRARTVDLVALPEMLPRIGGVAFDAPDSPNLEACPKRADQSVECRTLSGAGGGHRAVHGGAARALRGRGEAGERCSLQLIQPTGRYERGSPRNPIFSNFRAR